MKQNQILSIHVLWIYMKTQWMPIFKIMRLLKFLHSWFVLRILCLIIFLDSSPKSNVSSHTTTPYRSKDDRQLANMGRKLLLTHEKVQAESESMLESANKVSVWRKLFLSTLT